MPLARSKVPRKKTLGGGGGGGEEEEDYSYSMILAWNITTRSLVPRGKMGKRGGKTWYITARLALVS